MNDPKEPASTALASLHRVTVLYFALAVVGLAVTVLFFLVFPSVFSGIVALVSLVNLQAALLGRQYAKRASSR